MLNPVQGHLGIQTALPEPATGNSAGATDAEPTVDIDSRTRADRIADGIHDHLHGFVRIDNAHIADGHGDPAKSDAGLRCQFFENSLV